MSQQSYTHTELFNVITFTNTLLDIIKEPSEIIQTIRTLNPPSADVIHNNQTIILKSLENLLYRLTILEVKLSMFPYNEKKYGEITIRLKRFIEQIENHQIHNIHGSLIFLVKDIKETLLKHISDGY